MHYLRALRRHRDLTLTDVAMLTGIPARRLAEAEYGLSVLNYRERGAVATVFGLTDESLLIRMGGRKQPTARPLATDQAAAQVLMITAIAGTVAASTAQLAQRLNLPLDLPNFALPQVALVQEQAQPVVVRETTSSILPITMVVKAQAAEERRQEELAHQKVLARLLLEELPAPASETAQLLPETNGPTPALPAPRAPQFAMTEAGPQGCPVQPETGHVVMTQGYGVGSHAPAHVWGAVDLAVDGNGDGWAEPGSSWNAPIVATHAGTVRVTLESWPAGNHVWVTDSQTTWRTGYAHLAEVLVESGQTVEPGQVIGRVGSTGVASGPHLDYQVWNDKTNVDPTELVECK
ncbi:MAG: peptidoglycan DD-metalloendopeptidase family protein [Chloroflexaceae bacterium]|jgi:murein DD-endopeptidase MepM/ murein hydrolase activator NlpD|nr:peptidoglycan DD-metalloendopeptidase family protein [Chloroflexaceae bacterium]